MEYMWPLSQQNPQQFLVVFYEDLKKVSVNIWHSVFIIYKIGLESYKKKCDEWPTGTCDLECIHIKITKFIKIPPKNIARLKKPTAKGHPSG